MKNNKKYINKCLTGFLLAFALNPCMLLSQTFERTYGSLLEDEGQCIISAYDGGYLVAGFTYDTLNLNEVLLIKTDPAGNIVWSETIGGPNDDQSFWIDRASDSTYIMCGNSFDNANNKLFAFVIRLSKTGAILFEKLYTVNFDERAACVRQTSDSGFVTAGETVLGGVDLQMNLFKTDPAGNILWSKAFGDTEQESASYVKQTADHGFIVTGVARYGLSWSSIFIVKTDSVGNLQWSKKYNTQPYLSRCEVSRVLETVNGGYLVSGATSGNMPLKSVFLMELDSMGSILWQSLYSTGMGERNLDIIDEENGYVICGSTATNSGYDNALLMKTDYTGNLIWKLAYGVEDSNTVANSLVKTGDGKYMVAGYTDSYGAGITDVFLLKSDSVFDGSLCDMKNPPVIRDTISMVAMPINISSVVNMTGQNASFSVSTGVSGTTVCNGMVNVNSAQPPVLFEATPNPFSDMTTLTFKTKSAEACATLEIYDSFGRKIKSISDPGYASSHHFSFSSNESDISIRNGIYFFIFSAGAYRSAGKIIYAGG